jgi:hypothetical protein
VSRGLVVGLVLGGSALAVFASVAYSSAEIVEHGRLLPWGGDDIRKARVLGRFDVYISSETGQPSADLLNSYLLVATAAGCAAGALLLTPPHLRPMLVVAALGLGYLAIDEQFAIHESVGHNLGFLADLPGVKRPDDVILASYAIPAAIFVYVFREQLRQSPRAVRLLLAGLALFCVSAVWDLTGLPAEEVFELLPSLSILAAFACLMYDFAAAQRPAPA